MLEFPIQSVVFPNFEFGAPEEMYLRFVGAPHSSVLSQQRIVLNKGSVVTADTYFNAIAVETWKKNCRIDDLQLKLEGAGRLLLRFGLHREGHAHRWLSEQEIQLVPGSSCSIPMPFWGDLEAGLLYFSLMGLEDDAELTAGCFFTTTPALQDVHLGVVVTHFNRREYVLPAARRMEEQLLCTPAYGSRIELVIVDNSQNIANDETPGCVVIPNRNLGGSGGFMRGLMYLQDAGRFTHCLFMDDDASCEIESIRRAYALLSYATTPKMAVAGGLLRELEPSRMIEKGGSFDILCHALKAGLDVRHVHELMLAENNHAQPNYGAWWFFAFALADVERFTYPFFVRGDDIHFSIANQFNVVTMIGISCWGDDFGLKSGPMVYYLDNKHHLIHALVFGENSGDWVAKMITGFFRTQLETYCYGSAAAISLALEHVGKGPQFWIDNIDMADIRAQIGAIPHFEKMEPMERSNIALVYPGRRLTKLDRIIRSITRNGLMLPRKWLRNQILFQPKSFAGNKMEIYRYRWVYYEYEPKGIGFITEHNSNRAKRELRLFKRRLRIFLRNFDQIKQSYRDTLGHMTSREFWEEVYPDRQVPPPAALETRTAPKPRDTLKVNRYR